MVKPEKIAVLGHKDWVEGINPHQPTIKPYCKQATFILVKMWKCPSLLLIHVHLSRSRIARCNRHMYVLLTTIIMVVMHYPGYIIKMTKALIFSRINCHALPCPLSLEQALCVFWEPEANALCWQWKIHTLHIYAFRLVLCNKPIHRIGFVKKMQYRFCKAQKNRNIGVMISTTISANRQFSKALNMDILRVVSSQFRYSTTQDR